jgi:hypothetical protein
MKTIQILMKAIALIVMKLNHMQQTKVICIYITKIDEMLLQNARNYGGGSFSHQRIWVVSPRIPFVP